MEIALYDSTPAHRDNFIKLVNEWYYNDLLFHRVISWFMIQWGDPDSRGASADKRLGTGWPDYKIDAEIGELHYKGTLAAARQGWAINPEKKSSGSQFYIVQWTPQTQEWLERLAAQKWITYTSEQIEKYLEVWWTPMLDNDYTVFGEVISGMEVIDAIASTETWVADRPVTDISMTISSK
jgi:peptidyl-prolyl cis-trans isomerase B (cyclophilin B)